MQVADRMEDIILLALVMLSVTGCEPTIDGGAPRNGPVGPGGTPAAGAGGTAALAAEACSTTDIAAQATSVPVDIIWVVDNSGSMSEEESYVQTNLNSFSAAITASN